MRNCRESVHAQLQSVCTNITAECMCMRNRGVCVHAEQESVCACATAECV